MNSEFIRRRRRHAHLVAFVLISVLTGCQSETGTFNASASEKVAAEKGLKPGSSAAKVPGKVLKQGRGKTENGGSTLPTP
jgi:hypothetical protein